MKVRVSLDKQPYTRKPKDKEIAAINNRISMCPVTMRLEELADAIGNKGHTFCPATFLEGKRTADNFLETQLFVLDFDGGISLECIERRAEEYRLKIAFRYYTFSSTKENPKFRIAFLNDVPVTDKRCAKIIIRMLLKIFKEADQSCKDVSRMFFGGKGLIGQVESETIDIVNLATEFQRFVFEKESKNYKRDIAKFGEANNIYVVNNCLGISCVHKDGTFDDFLASDPYIYRSAAVFPSNSPRYAVIFGYQGDVRKKANEFLTVRVDLGESRKQCRLYRDFINSPHISHNERYLLMLNMIHMKGGGKRFLSVINEKKYNKSKWRFYMTYAKDKGYKPQGCDSVCPYADFCDHKANLVLTLKKKDKIRKLDGEEEYNSVEEVFHYISAFLEDAINQKIKGLYLIPAQTAVGKTEAYCNMIRSYEQQRFIVAVPTNQLKREVEARLKGMGIQDVLVTPSIDEMELPEELKGEIKWLYQLGLGRKVSEVLRRFVRENKDSSRAEIIEGVEWSSEYLRMEGQLRDKRVIVTTHARLITFTEDIIKDYQVIIDEDILSTFFKNIREVSLSSLNKALEIESISEALEERIRQILDSEEGRYEKLIGSSDYGYIPRSELEKKDIYEDINSIAFASVFQKEGEHVRYFYPQMLPREKYIVLSATINKTLYQKYFYDWYVKSYPYYRARYMGKLIQRTALSMSRQCIQDNEKRLSKFISCYGNGYEIITFQQYEGLFNTCGIHFGNAEGVDRLKGRNLIVIGTPHQNEFVYKLTGYHLGMAVDQDTLAVRRIRSGGYEFNLMTYKGEELRELQMYYIRKDLEQCIGRARLLRNECEVVVLPNFPCEQAELDQRDYLEAMESSDSEVCGPGMAGKL